MTDTVRQPAKVDRPETDDAGKADFSFEVSLLDGPSERPDAPFSTPFSVSISSSASAPFESETAAPARRVQQSDMALDEKKPSDSADRPRCRGMVISQQHPPHPDNQFVEPGAPTTFEPAGAKSIALQPAPLMTVTSNNPLGSAAALPVTELAPEKLGLAPTMPASRSLGTLSPNQSSAPPDTFSPSESSRHTPLQKHLAAPLVAEAPENSSSRLAPDEVCLLPPKTTSAPQLLAETPTAQHSLQSPPQTARLSNLPNTILQSAPLQINILARPASAHASLTPQNEVVLHDDATSPTSLESTAADVSSRDRLREPIPHTPRPGPAAVSGTTAPLISAFRADSTPDDSIVPLHPKEIEQVTGATLPNLALNSVLSDLTDRQAMPPRYTSPATQAAQGIVLAAQDKTAPTTELTLSPEELGKVRFEITSQDDRLAVRLFAERPETLDLLRRQSDLLLAELKQAGYAQSSLSFGAWSQNRNTASTSHNQTSTTEIGDEQVPDSTPLTKSLPLLVSGRLHIRL
ncbi:flagellar hook-length control protein FliK [Pseudotabrizicola sp. L79]|uniref:flagellar hook-length control protein FliK n=1 Tax=Pseudotabrizicola sp. L79 TaxID=3118402 RepID=UPI002F95A41A